VRLRACRCVVVLAQLTDRLPLGVEIRMNAPHVEASRPISVGRTHAERSARACGADAAHASRPVLSVPVAVRGGIPSLPYTAKPERPGRSCPNRPTVLCVSHVKLLHYLPPLPGFIDLDPDSRSFSTCKNQSLASSLSTSATRPR
jgi:hypothetical protein